jgi:hypothetical protein
MALDEAGTAFLRQMAASSGKPLREMTPAQARGLTTMQRDLITARHDVLRDTVEAYAPRLIEAAVPV